jgi:hypothetical protein
VCVCVRILTYKYSLSHPGTLREKVSSELNAKSLKRTFQPKHLRLLTGGSELTNNLEKLENYCMYSNKFIVTLRSDACAEIPTSRAEEKVEEDETEEVQNPNLSAELLSSQYFEDIFALLRGFGKDDESSKIAHSAWRLIKKLTPSKHVKERMSREASKTIHWKQILPSTISNHTGQHCYTYELLYGVRLFWNKIQDIKWCRASFEEGAFDVMLNLITKDNSFVLNEKQHNEVCFEPTLSSLQLITYDRLMSTYEDLALKLDMFVENETGTLLVREKKIFEETSLSLPEYVNCALISVTRLSKLYSKIPKRFTKYRERAVDNVNHTLRLLVPTLIASKRTTEILGSEDMRFKDWLNTHLLRGPHEIGDLVLKGLQLLCDKSNFARYLFEKLWNLYFFKAEEEEEVVEEKETSLCYFTLLCHIVLRFQDTFSIDKITNCLKSATDCLQKCSTKNVANIINVCRSLVKSSSSSSSETLEILRKRLADVTFRKCFFLAQHKTMKENIVLDTLTREPAMLLLRALAISSESVRIYSKITFLRSNSSLSLSLSTHLN